MNSLPIRSPRRRPPRLSRRRLLALAGGAPPWFALAACGEAASETLQAPTGELVLATDWGVGPRGALLAQALDTFAAARPDVQVNVKLGNPAGARSASPLSGEQAPDLTIGAPSRLRLFVNAVQLTDITEHLRVSVPEIADTHYDMPGNATVANRRYGMPFALTQGAWVYDASQFEATGVDLPLAGFTIPRYIEAARRLTDSEASRFGTWLGSDMRSWGTLVAAGAADAASAASLLTADERDSILHLDASRGDYERMLGITVRDRVAPSPPQLAAIGAASGVPGIGAGQQAAVAFARRNIAMLPLTGGFAGAGSELIGERFSWDFMLGPRHDVTERRWTWVDNSSHWVTGRAERRGRVEAAADLAVHLAGPDMGELLAETRDFTPDHRRTANSDRYLRAPPKSMLVVLITSEIAGRLGYGPPEWEAWQQTLTRSVARHLAGDVPLERAFDDLQAAGRAALAGQPA